MMPRKARPGFEDEMTRHCERSEATRRLKRNWLAVSLSLFAITGPYST
jgi:hypothetical protein